VKLAEYRKTFYEFSGKASDVSRQLSFAAIAIIWLFKNDLPGGGHPTIPHALIFPGILIVTALAADLLQYTLASLIWRLYYRYLEKKRVPPRRRNTAQSLVRNPDNRSFLGQGVSRHSGLYFYLVILARGFRTDLGPGSNTNAAPKVDVTSL
jgi:hypothetical protein